VSNEIWNKIDIWKAPEILIDAVSRYEWLRDVGCNVSLSECLDDITREKIMHLLDCLNLCPELHFRFARVLEREWFKEYMRIWKSYKKSKEILSKILN